MINLNVDNLAINDYNKLLVSKVFYEKIPTEIFLIFIDVILLSFSFREGGLGEGGGIMK
jgi:hypothetical protein